MIGIGVDTTGSTPIPVDAQNRPLALDPRWQANLAAHAWLWKDHTGADEAAAITRTAREHAPQYLAPIGGVYSSEWFWSKIWHCLKVAPDVFDAACSWVELADFVPAVLAGVDDPRADRARRVRRRPQGHVLGRLGRPAVEGVPGAPRPEARGAARPALRRGPRGRPAGGRLSHGVGREARPARGHPDRDGRLRRAPAAPSAPASRAGTLVKIIGTSTCDCAVACRRRRSCPTSPASAASCPARSCRATTGSRPASRRWATSCAGGSRSSARATRASRAALGRGRAAAARRVGPPGARLEQRQPHDPGRPAPHGPVLGQTLHTTRAEIYRALVEATAFGARAIVERLREHGVAVERVVCCGGIAEKNDVFMQIYADVLGRPMLVAGSAQTPALGSAVAAAVSRRAAGGHASFEAAQAKMTRLPAKRFDPDPAARASTTRSTRSTASSTTASAASRERRRTSRR